MVSLEVVHASNARLKELGPGLVALFVGATSGIGEYTAKAFVHNAISPRVYIVGRNQDAANRIIKECETANKDGKVEFIKADVSELSEVDRVCKEIAKKEKHLNLIFQTQGNLNLRGRDESSEGLDRKMALNYYSRMRFISNLLPLLRTATTTPPHFSRSVSVLGSGGGTALDTADLDLKNTFTGSRCAGHTITMNDLMTTEFAQRESGITFSHCAPGAVKTNLARELPFWARTATKVLYQLITPLTVGQDETGARQLFMATSGIYPPSKPVEGAASASGVSPDKTIEVTKGASGSVGDGGYNLTWKGGVTNGKMLPEYRQNGVSKTVWEHTMNVFARVEKINQERGNVK
ncbi:Oxidoreductase andH [Hyphodiscus hymeniophilus]|uniref:Oxidoreductase andH n=1 Tax=Hyphodiscus hymeniophilus TaxID=353542 RepID=A0A9P6VJ75_9HELO|nr:Oxidoreductase andH [Hyphodiscus hymeniophilus]